VPAEAVRLTRLNYWGLLQPKEFWGFHRTEMYAVYPAPVAYGRSYGVYIVHYRDPLTTAWSIAGELEELKDSVLFKSSKEGCTEKKSKDVTVLSYGRVHTLAGGAEIVTVLGNLVSPSGKDSNELDKVVADTLSQAVQLLERVEEPIVMCLDSSRKTSEAMFSRSLYYDVVTECNTLRDVTESVACDLDYSNLLGKLLKYIVCRNKKHEQCINMEWLEKYSSIWIRLADTKSASDVALSCNAPLSWQIVTASHLLYSTRR
jgi:CRISPR-associated protein Cmr2